MRWKYLIPRGILLAMMWLFFTFTLDPLLKRAAIFSGQVTTGTRIDVAQLATGFFPPTIDVNETQVANRHSPGTNLIEWNHFHLSLEGGPLLKKSFIVDEASLTGLKFGTPRDDDGRSDDLSRLGSQSSELANAFQQKVKNAGSHWLGLLTEKAKDRLDPRKLETARVADARHANWKKRFDTLEAQIKDFERRAKQIESRVKSGDGNELQKLQRYRQAAADVRTLLDDVQQVRAEMSQLPQIARNDQNALNQARLRDLESIEQTVGFLRLDSDLISESLLGPELAAHLDFALSWIGWLNDSAEQLAQYEAPDRTWGEDIVFRRKVELPRYLIRKLNVSGEAKLGGELVPFQGQVTGLTSEPAVYGKPIVAHVEGSGPVPLTLDLTLDRTGDVPIHTAEFTCAIPNSTEMELGDADKFALQVSGQRAKLRVRLRLTGEQIEGDVRIAQAAVALKAKSDAKLNPRVKKMFQHAFDNVSRLEIAVAISGTLDEPHWMLWSNIGDELANGLNGALASEFAAQRRNLESQVAAAAHEQIEGFNASLGKRYTQLNSELQLSESHARRIVEKAAGGRGLNLNGLLRLK